MCGLTGVLNFDRRPVASVTVERSNHRPSRTRRRGVWTDGGIASATVVSPLLRLVKAINPGEPRWSLRPRLQR